MGMSTTTGTFTLGTSPRQWQILHDRIERNIEDVLNEVVPPRAQTVPPRERPGSLWDDLLDSNHDLRLDSAYADFYQDQRNRSDAQLPSPLETPSLLQTLAHHLLDKGSGEGTAGVQQLYDLVQELQEARALTPAPAHAQLSPSQGRDPNEPVPDNVHEGESLILRPVEIPHASSGLAQLNLAAGDPGVYEHLTPSRPSSRQAFQALPMHPSSRPSSRLSVHLETEQRPFHQRHGSGGGYPILPESYQSQGGHPGVQSVEAPPRYASPAHHAHPQQQQPHPQQPQQPQHMLTHATPARYASPAHGSAPAPAHMPPPRYASPALPQSYTSPAPDAPPPPRYASPMPDAPARYASPAPDAAPTQRFTSPAHGYSAMRHAAPSPAPDARAAIEAAFATHPATFASTQDLPPLPGLGEQDGGGGYAYSGMGGRGPSRQQHPHNHFPLYQSNAGGGAPPRGGRRWSGGRGHHRSVGGAPPPPPPLTMGGRPPLEPPSAQALYAAYAANRMPMVMEPPAGAILPMYFKDLSGYNTGRDGMLPPDSGPAYMPGSDRSTGRIPDPYYSLSTQQLGDGPGALAPPPLGPLDVLRAAGPQGPSYYGDPYPGGAPPGRLEGHAGARGGSGGGGGGGGGGGSRGSARAAVERKPAMQHGAAPAPARGGRVEAPVAGPTLDAGVRELSGKMLAMAREQHGCRYLQRLLAVEDPEGVQLLLDEVMPQTGVLMVDPFGNYLIQKVLEVATPAQRRTVLERACEAGLSDIACNTHGTRAVQKLVESIEDPVDAGRAVGELQPDALRLILDSNGNHVIQRCLQKFAAPHTAHFHDVVISNCREVAKHRHGCCVLQRCIDYAAPEKKRGLVLAVSEHGLELAQNAFGNYVVQYILDTGLVDACNSVLSQLQGRFADLACQKFASNVVEKALKLSVLGMEGWRDVIVQELVEAPDHAALLRDQFGNYVLQSALRATAGETHSKLVAAIKPHMASLRGLQHGKRILQQLQGVV